MTGIMIVDDEIIMRECLKTTIEWDKYNCSVVAEASDGESALELYKKTLPDIIITDIVMTSTNGLDFIANIRQLNPDVGIIILSGYDRFEYARTALMHNVSAYLLKPVENEVIIAEVLKLQNKIERNKQLQNTITSKNTANRNDFLLNMLNAEELDTSVVDILCKNYDINPPSDKYSVAILQIDSIDKKNTKQEFILLKETLNFYICTSKDLVLYTASSNKLIVLCIYASVSSDICDFIKQIQVHFKQTCSNTFTAGVSGVFKTLSIFRRAYQQAVSALEQKAAFGVGSIIRYTDISSSPENAATILFQEDVNEIISAVTHGNTEKAVKILNNYFKGISALWTVNIAKVKDSILELIILLIHTVVKNSNMMHAVFGRDFFPSVELQSLDSISAIRSWTMDIIEKISTCPDLLLPDRYSPALSKAILYIRANYTQKIKLEDIAKELFVSSRSLSRMFLSETGKSCLDYITEYRINMALHLLKTTSYKICDIAALVGYNDIKHFHKTFRKITGHTPKFYRQGTEDEN